MDSEERIRNEIERTLEHSGRTERLTAGPFFYARVQARIAASPRRGVAAQTWGLARPAALALLVAINLITAAACLRSGWPRDDQRQELVSAFARAYALDGTDSAF